VLAVTGRSFANEGREQPDVELRELSRAEIVVMVGVAADRAGVPRDELMALVAAESAFDPSAISPRGARGLTQLMPATALELGITEDTIDDPLTNLMGGAAYLRQQIDRFGNLPQALAAYNAGPSRAERPSHRWPAETKAYVARIMDTLGRSEEVPPFSISSVAFASAEVSSDVFIGGNAKSRPSRTLTPPAQENPDA
jgi:soluble lytic murein transglycosylase-like protein